MKRILSLTLGLALLTLVFAPAALARPIDDGQRVNLQMWDPNAEVMAASTNQRADTAFLFAASGDGSYGMAGTVEWGYTFDDLGTGSAAPAGFYGIDNTASPGPYWNIHTTDLCTGTNTDIQFAIPFGGGTNTYAVWCGAENQCGWENPTGYGSGWNQWCIVENTVGGSTMTIQFDWTHDYEGDAWDNFRIEVEVDGVLTEVFSNLIGGPEVIDDEIVLVDAATYGGSTLGDIVFIFKSDGNTDDQYGLFTSNVGAVWMDNMIITQGATDIFREDFEDGLVPAGMSFDVPAGAGQYATLYSNLFAEDICFLNNTYAWAFFDLLTSNPDYPIPVIAYGPPYVDNFVASPLLEVDQNGDPFVLDSETEVWLNYFCYYDMPLNPLIFQNWEVAAKTLEVPCLGPWKNDLTVWYGEFKQWSQNAYNVTQYIAESANNGTVNGIAVRVGAVDMCEAWCGVHGDGTGHTPGPFFDNVSVRLVSGSAIAWDISSYHRFQDNFPEAGNGLVRIDSAYNVEPDASTTVVIGDSTMIECVADLAGGFASHMNGLAGEERPNIYMWYRITEGPNAGYLGADTADQDDLDGIYSPYDGTAEIDAGSGEYWMIAVADSAAYQGTISESRWAFDLNDEFFEPGDVIQHFFRVEAVGSNFQTRPEFAMSSDPELRGYYLIRCLPTAGNTLLFADDAYARGPWPLWREAFRYNGYVEYDVYSTQGPSSGLQNGLAGRATTDDIEQYEMICWDSGGLPSYTITDEGPQDKVFDTDLLEYWIENAEHPAYFWVMGNQVANDLGTGDAFLSSVMGAALLDPALYYDDYTGILVPFCRATEPRLAYLDGEPTFWVDGGCPGVEDFSVVVPTGSFAVTAHEWPESPSGVVAGILNEDPDGNGSLTNNLGFETKVLYNPFSYMHVWDAGYGLPAGADYARLMVGHVLQNLFSFGPDGQPDSAPEVPAFTKLEGNFPNPFNPKTTIRFSLANAGDVTLQVYDISGRTVATLLDGQNMAAQAHEVVWDGTTNTGDRAASGIYFYKLIADGKSFSDKMVMLK